MIRKNNREHKNNTIEQHNHVDLDIRPSIEAYTLTEGEKKVSVSLHAVYRELVQIRFGPLQIISFLQTFQFVAQRKPCRSGFNFFLVF